MLVLPYISALITVVVARKYWLLQASARQASGLVLDGSMDRRFGWPLQIRTWLSKAVTATCPALCRPSTKY